MEHPLVYDGSNLQVLKYGDKLYAEWHTVYVCQPATVELTEFIEFTNSEVKLYSGMFKTCDDFSQKLSITHKAPDNTQVLQEVEVKIKTDKFVTV